MQTKNLNIVVLSRGPKLYSTSRILEEGRKRGHNIFVVDPLQCDIVLEQKKPLIYYKGELLENVDAVIPRVGASVTFYGTAVVRQFEMMNVYTTTPSQSIVRSRDKLRSLQILTREGVGIPKTVFTNHSKDPEAIIAKVGGAPCIIKLLEGTQGIGVVLAETKSAASSVLEAFQGLDARVIVQEFIEEAKGADIRVLIVNGEIIGAMKRQGKEGEFRSNLHRGGTAKVIKLTRAEQSAAKKAAKAMGLSICGVDLLQSKKGPMIMEVNSSPGLEGIEGATEINIAGKIIDQIELNYNRNGNSKSSY